MSRRLKNDLMSKEDEIVNKERELDEIKESEE